MNKEKQNYLANRMIDGARALYDLFEWLKTSREPLTDKKVEEITQPYELTQNQGKYLHKTITRAKRAQGIVRHFENNFGVDENLNFQDSEGLHNLLFKNKYCPKKIQAKSYNVGIGFTKQRWNHKNSLGQAGIGFYYDQVDSPLERTIQRLEKGKLTNCANLCFRVPTKKYIENIINEKRQKLDEKERVILVIFGPSIEQEAEKYYNQIINHELRHVIDKILPRSYGYSEAQTYIYADEEFKGLNLDLNKTSEIIERQKKYRLERMEKLKELEAPNAIIKSGEAMYNYKLKLGENYEQSLKFLKQLAPKLPEKDFGMLSYIFSTLPDSTRNNSLSHLKLLNSFYENQEKGN